MYPNVDMSLLDALRVGSGDELDAAWVVICGHAADIGAMINPLEYVPYLDDDGVSHPTETLSKLLHNSDENSTQGPYPRGGVSVSTSGAYEDSNRESETSSTEHSKELAANQTRPIIEP